MWRCWWWWGCSCVDWRGIMVVDWLMATIAGVLLILAMVALVGRRV